MALKQNIIYIYFKGKHQVTSKSQYQYNRRQYLYFADLNLPQAFEVHFSNKDKGESKTQIGSDNLVEIPDEYFWNGALQIYAWIYLHSKTTDGETIYEVRIPLTKRAKPTDEEPLPVQQSTIDRAIAELNNAVDITTENANKTDSDKIIVSNIKEDVITLKENIDSTATTINQKAQETIDASERAETSAQNAATSENKALNYSQQAEQSAQSALESKNIAQQKSEVATNASNEALGYRNEALEAKNQAVQAKQYIVDYRDETKGYRDETLNFKNDVQTLKNQIDETAEEIEDISDSVKEDVQSASQSASSASQSANSASQSANSANQSADNANQSANSASQSASQAEEFKNQSATNVTHYPKVVDGYWYVWDASKNDYVNTNVDARGIKGDKGDIGKTGNGIENTVLNSDYTLTITFTDGTSYTTPSIRGEKGIKGDVGNGIASTVLNNDYTLTITFTDGTQYTTPPIRGKQGDKGDKGDKGDTGATGAQGERGEKGDKGDTGAQGIQGEQGIQGIQGVQGEKGDKGDKGDTGEVAQAEFDELSGEVSDLKEGLSAMSTATSADVGKALKAKTVTNGKVTEWEFGMVGSPTDSALSPTSENPVQNKTLYNELNILTSSAEDVTYINADTETPGGYNGTACAIDILIDGEAIIKSVDVRVKTGVTAKLGRWSFRPHSESFPNRGYYKLEEILGTVVSSDTHAVFNLNNFEYDRTTDILIVTTPANDIGYHLNVSNTINAFWMTSNGFNDVEVGSESTTIVTHPMSGTIQGAFTVVYSQGGTVTATPVKSIVEDLDDDMTAIRTATAGDVGKALKAKTVTDGKVTEWEFGDAGGTQITVDDEISDVSENPVQNKVLYDELNIVKTETIVPTETTYTNGEIIQPQYNGYAVSVEIPETDDVVLKQVDVRVKTGVTAKLGIWTFRKYSDALPYRGYFTLSQLLGTVESADTHAVFNLNDVQLDPATQILMITTGEQGIGIQTGMTNDLMPFVDTSSSNTLNSMAVGDETTTIYTWRYEGGNYGVQGAYSVTYEPTETKTITTITNVKDAVDGLIIDVADIKNNAGTIANEMLRTPINKYFVVIVDDVTRDALTVADQLLAIGVRPAFALKMESMGVDISWAEVKKLQDMGFEICFHGMLHSRYNTAPDDDAIMIADIAEYKALCKEHGIVLHGYAGPVHYPLPVGAFKEFEWARTPYGLQGYGSGNHLTTTFASVIVWSCDPVNNAVPTSTMIAAANTLSDNQYLTPMLHCINLVAYLNDYLTVFNSWISAGLTPLRPMDAVKQSLFNSGGIGDNSTFEIQAGTATNPYFLIAGNGSMLSSNS